jgi:hypothetical protein
LGRNRSEEVFEGLKEEPDNGLIDGSEEVFDGLEELVENCRDNLLQP